MSFFEVADDTEIDGEWQYGDSKFGMSVSKIETALRCTICSDFFSNPHSLPCGHSFCSECIRKHLDKMFNPTTSDTCPSCREKAVVSQLRVSRDLIDIVQYFRDARPIILTMIDGTHSVDTEVAGSRASSRSSSNSSKLSATVQRMPQRVFHIESKDKVKKALEKLTEHCAVKIRTDGDKDMLVKRYSEFVHLNNAQLSAKFPLSLAEMVTELHKREKARERTLKSNKKTEQVVKNLRNGMESDQAKKGFADLVKRAREQKAAKMQAMSSISDYGDGHGDDEAAQPVILLEYSQSQVSSASESCPKKRRRRGRQAAGAEGQGGQERTTRVLQSPCPSRGKAVHGTWCVVWSDVMKRLFFYNVETETGQIDVPAELVGVYGSNGMQGPGIDRLREDMARGEGSGPGTTAATATDEVRVDCTLLDSPSGGLDLTGDDLTQDLLLCSTAHSSRTAGAGPVELDDEQPLGIVEDSPYASVDGSQCSSDQNVLKLSSGRRVSSSYEIATVLMRRVESAATEVASSTYSSLGVQEGQSQEGGVDVVACPVCTYHNSRSAKKCEICVSLLPSAGPSTRKTRQSSQSQPGSSQATASVTSSSRASKRARRV